MNEKINRGIIREDGLPPTPEVQEKADLIAELMFKVNQLHEEVKAQVQSLEAEMAQNRCRKVVGNYDGFEMEIFLTTQMQMKNKKEGALN